MALIKRRKVSQPGKAPKRRRPEPDQEADLDTDIWGASEEEASDEQDEGAVETAEEKRLRIAKAYLQQLRAEGAEDSDGGDQLPGGIGAALRDQALEALGQQSRKLADRIDSTATASTSGRVSRCHWQPATAVTLTADDSKAYSVCKHGQIAAVDIETGKWTSFRASSVSKKQAAVTQARDGPEWVKHAARAAGKAALLAAAVSDDGQLLAVGGGDRFVHVFDARSHELVKSFPGHRDAVTGLAFRQGTHELYSCALDRTVKTWNIDDRTYIDTLFGHQAEVLALDVLRAERALSTGHDHTCRVWKIADESQLICRAAGMALDCCRYVTGTEWLTGSSDGSLALWTQFKKKPVAIIPHAHALPSADPSTVAADTDGAAGVDARSWIQSVAAAHNSDLAASGAGNGCIKLWALRSGKGGRPEKLDDITSIPAPGFVNGLQLAHSGRFVVAAVGQEPRLGRWGRIAGVRNGVLIHQLSLQD
ncbi:hypothetical protein WJX73_010914 [Symbiochloris irregularis]|uniref:U3 small nucleolar RNA-interacting protein 2 n=1 Tax=Symbiochloris irregularis TaxID=706552 RepID=A0AAW1PCS5_9CHLO